MFRLYDTICDCQEKLITCKPVSKLRVHQEVHAVLFRGILPGSQPESRLLKGGSKTNNRKVALMLLPERIIFVADLAVSKTLKLIEHISLVLMDDHPAPY